MKKDILRLAAVAFVVGIVFSSFDIKDILPGASQAPAAFQQGFALE